MSSMVWKSVDDELPDDDTVVLIGNAAYLDVGYLEGGQWLRTGGRSYDAESGVPWEVTHWMALPVPFAQEEAHPLEGKWGYAAHEDAEQDDWLVDCAEDAWDPSKEDLDELEERVQAVIRQWCLETGNVPQFGIVNRIEPVPQWTTRELIHELRGTTCQCGAHKESRQTFCHRCYYQLSKPQRTALYRLIGSGYEQAYADAMQTLGREGSEED